MVRLCSKLLVGCGLALTIVSAAAANDASARAIAALRSSAEAGDPEAIQSLLTSGASKNRAVSVFKRSSPVGELLMMKFDHERLMVFFDFVNWTKPLDDKMAYYAEESTEAGVAHLANGGAELDLKACKLFLKPAGSASWSVTVSSDCHWAADDLSPEGTYGRVRCPPWSGRELCGPRTKTGRRSLR